MTTFTIRKRFRIEDEPYDGPSCGPAGVEPGRIYTSRAEAQADADKLSAVNPVGFEVVQCDPPPLE